MSRHGGARRGAGRPRKWHLDDVLRIGQACECKWREAVNVAFDVEQEKLFRVNSDIADLWNAAQSVPISKRKAWLRSEAYDLHRDDIETELAAMNGTSPSPRIVSIKAKPPRGTRKQIIKEVASQSNFAESVVDNLWQAYRRLERELRDSAET